MIQSFSLRILFTVPHFSSFHLSSTPPIFTTFTSFSHHTVQKPHTYLTHITTPYAYHSPKRNRSSGLPIAKGVFLYVGLNQYLFVSIGVCVWPYVSEWVSICLEGGYGCLFRCVCQSVWEGVCMSVGMAVSVWLSFWMGVFIWVLVCMCVWVWVCLTESVWEALNFYRVGLSLSQTITDADPR